METNKTKLRNNIIMIAAIVVIICVGILIVGSIKGWFVKDAVAADTFGYLKKVSGIVSVERDGVSFEFDKESLALKAEDIIETSNKTQTRIVIGKSTVDLNENSKIRVDSLTDKNASFTLLNGEAFVTQNAGNECEKISIDGWSFTAQKSAFALSARKGATTVTVFEGDVTGKAESASESATAGKGISIVNNKAQLIEVELTSLNDFVLKCIKSTDESHKLCFSIADVDKLIEERAAKAGKTDGSIITIDGEVITEAGSNATSGENKDVTQSGSSDSTTKKQGGTSSTTKKTNGTTKKNETTTKASSGNVMSCTIEIRCDTILQDYNGKPNMDNLTPGKAAYVPSNGIILACKTVQFKDGETAFDVLKRVCSIYNIQLEYSYTPMYGSYYIEGINNLYEFDCGGQSGWMFAVNGWFPNYGCSSYKMGDGDTMVWMYTCNGLGEDVGCEWMGE